MNRLGHCCLALALGAFAGGADAATLVSVSGDVLVNTGNGYFKVSGPVTLKEGDMIMASAGGSAVLSCDGGRTINIQAGQVVTVCDATSNPVDLEAPSETATGGIPNGMMIVGVGVVTGTAAIIGLQLSSSDKPVSGQ